MKPEFTPDQIVCISHPDSVSRLEQMHQRFLSQGMNVTLSPGVDPLPGEEKFVGCLRAHQKAVSRAKELKLPNILIFEDDVVFTQTWSWIKSKLADVPDDFDIVRLSIITEGAYYREHIRGNIFRCWRAYGTQCYLLNAKAYDRILNFPATDPYDSQLADAGLIEYAIHPLPLYHELGTSLLGNHCQQTRDDLPGEELSRETAIKIIDEVLADHVAPYQTQLRIVQALSLLRERPHTQELRFLQQVLQKVEVTREQAITLAKAWLELSTQQSAPGPKSKA